MKISHSQMSDFQKCEKRFDFAQNQKLRPKNYPEAMARGIFGHDLFKAFFLAMAAGKSYEECVEATTQLIQTEIESNIGSPNLAVYRHVLAFGAYAFQMEWVVISCEDNFLNPTPVADLNDEQVVFAFTPDIVFQWTKGPRRGSNFMLDFKFTGQPWNDAQMNMYQQLPKYMIHWNLMHPDKKVSQLGVVNLFTRASVDATGEALYRIKWLKVTKEKLERINFENEVLLRRIAEARSNPNHVYLRTSDSFQCKMCFFGNDICAADLEGRDISKYIAINYEENTYFDDNYNKDEVEE